MCFDLKNHSVRFLFNQHLRGRSCFDRTIRQGKRWTTQGLKVYFYPNGLGYSRLGLILSKKNIKKACKRNQIKRQLKEGFRLSQQQLPCMDYVVMGYRELVKMERLELHQLVVKLWQSLSVTV